MFLSCAARIKQDLAILPPYLHQGLHYLMEQNFAETADGRQQIHEDCYAVISSYHTEPWEVRKPEAHRQYIDIQFIVSGAEVIGHADLTVAGKLQEAIPERDLFFYEDMVYESRLHLQQGSYAIFYPWDVHRPNCNANGAGSVKKVVVKVRFPGP